MDPPFAQHAAAVAREVVRLGLSDQPTARRLYQEYTHYLQRGVRASFTQLLLSRGVIDPAAYQRLQASLPLEGALSSPAPNALATPPSASTPNAWGSPPPASASTPNASAAWAAATPQALAPSSRGGDPCAQTSGFEGVLAPGSLEESLDEDSPLMLSDEAGVHPDTPPYEAPPSLLESTPAASQTPDAAAGLELAPPDPVPSERDPRADFIMSASADGGQARREPEPGEVIGNYELVKLIGRGGMGVIYKARKQGSDEHYAVKVLLGGDDKGSDRRRQRFRREVEAMRRLEHERIVGVHDYGRVGNFDWYAMDYVEGRDFETLLEEGELEPHEKMQVFFDICEAMAHAHERNVIHRDLKPQNVIVDKAGRGHVLDFGLAKIMDQGIGMTRTGSALGTPYYMAPEQLRSAKHIDQRADVFSLGVILYEITTGQRPFQGETAAEVGTNILNTDPPLPTSIKKSLHPDIDGMVLKALEKDPERRYQSANDLLADLIRHRKGFGVGGAKGVTGAAGSLRRWATRNRSALIGAGAAAAVLFPALVYLALSGDEPPRRRRRRPLRTAARVDPPPSTARPAPAKNEEPPASPRAGGSSSAVDDEGRRIGAKPTEEEKPREGRDEPPPTRRPAENAAAAKSSEEGSERATEEQAARTPREAALLALRPPEAKAAAGAARARAANGTLDTKRAVRGRLDGDVWPAMAVGDFARARTALKDIVRDPDVRGISALVREVEEDMETLAKLRRLIAESLREDSRRLRRASFYEGDRFSIQELQVREDDLLLLRGRDASALVDPFALELEDLEAIVLGRGTKKEGEGDLSAVHYALGLLELYRGADRSRHLDEAGSLPAAKRRRETIAWLKALRNELDDAAEKDAENEWRALEKKKDSSLLRGLEAYVRDHGQTRAWRSKREQWIDRVSELRRDGEDLFAAKLRKGFLRWRFRGEEVGDFDIEPVDPKRPFGAVRQSGAVVLENGRLSLSLEDYLPERASAELSSRDEDLIEVFLGDLRQEVDPDATWQVFLGRRKLVEEQGSRKMTKAKRIEFDVKEGARVFRIGPKDLEVPANAFRNLRPRKPRFGVGSKAHLRVTELQLEWPKQGAAKAPLLRRRLVARDLLLREQEANTRPGRGARILLDAAARDERGLVLHGEWRPGGRGLEAPKGGVLWSTRGLERGKIEFEYECREGTELRFQLGVRPGGRKPAQLSWILPVGADAVRKGVCWIDLDAKVAQVVVDGLWLTGPSRLPTRSVYPSLRFGDDASGRVRKLRIVAY
ncbi:MAG: serine/threonine protein kinase [Planctomycetota bacterium]|nr:MAG: serine/threonine protein kinase [Planctomycetota bacterium]